MVRGLIATVLACLLSVSAEAADVALRWVTPQGTVIEERVLALADVDALPQKEVRTDTQWTDPVTFSGPSLAELAKLGNRPVVEAEVFALNDYSAKVPAEDWEKRGAILASRIDGKTMPIRDKGPYWVMYPIDDDPALATQEYFARMVWQVSRIDFVVE